MFSYILTMTRLNALLSDNRIVPLNKKYEKNKCSDKFINKQKVRPKNYHNKGVHRTTNKDMSHRQRR